MNITINKALVLGKLLRERINDLKGLRTQVATRKSWLGTPERGEVTEPTYDIREMDKSILKLQKMSFELESLIKEQNNLVKVSFNYDEDDIFVGLV